MPPKDTKKPRDRESPSGHHFYELYTNCPRKHYFKYGLGLKPIKTREPLLFGGAMHKAMAHYYQHFDQDPEKLIKAAIKVFAQSVNETAQEYERQDDYDLDVEKGPLLLRCWHNTWYRHDHEKYRIIEIENEREVPLGPNSEFTLTVRPDLVIQNKATGRYHVKDTKTTSWSTPGTFKSADYQDQMTTYLWALNKMEPGWDIEDAIIDVLFVRKSQAKDPAPGKRFTTPKAERPGRIYRSKEALDIFELGIYGLILEISQKYDNLDDFPPELLFKRNGQCCSKFGCEYEDICRTRVEADDLPTGFERDEWKSDLSQLAERAKEYERDERDES